MKVDNLKQLEQLIKLCRKTGIEAIEVDGIKFNLGSLPKRKSKFQDPALDIPESQVKIVYNQVQPVKQTVAETVADVIKTDELSPEDLLFYSSSGQLPQDQN